MRVSAAMFMPLLFAACTLGTREPIPLRGDPPVSILILPIEDGTEQPEVARGLLATVEKALVRRGYYVIPIDVGLRLLSAMELSVDHPPNAARLAEIAEATGVGGFLRLDVKRWDAVYAPRLLRLRYHLVYRIYEAGSSRVIWDRVVKGNWIWDPEFAFIDHEPFLYASPGRYGDEPSPYRDTIDIGRVMHRSALARLPVGSAH